MKYTIERYICPTDITVSTAKLILLKHKVGLVRKCIIHK